MLFNSIDKSNDTSVDDDHKDESEDILLSIAVVQSKAKHQRDTTESSSHDTTSLTLETLQNNMRGR